MVAADRLAVSVGVRVTALRAAPIIVLAALYQLVPAVSVRVLSKEAGVHRASIIIPAVAVAAALRDLALCPVALSRGLARTVLGTAVAVLALFRAAHTIAAERL